MKRLLRVISFSLALYAQPGMAVAQTLDLRDWDLPHWVSGGPYQLMPAYQQYLDQRSRRAPEGPGRNERLVAWTTSFANSSGTLVLLDSTRFWYSGNRGMEKSRHFLNDYVLPAERKFDSVIRFEWRESDNSFVPSYRLRRYYDGNDRATAFESAGFGSGSWQPAATGTVWLSAAGRDSFATDIPANPALSAHATRFEYNAAGDLAVWRQLRQDPGSGWNEIQEVRYTYDSQDRLAQMDIIQKWPATPSEAQYQFTYTPGGKFESLTLRLKVGGAWQNQVRWISKYDSKNQEIIRVFYNGLTGTRWNTNDSFSISALTPSGLPLSGTAYSVINGAVSTEYRRSYQYDSRELQTGMYTERWIGAGFVNASAVINTYTPTGRRASETALTWDGAAWTSAGSDYEWRFYWELYPGDVATSGRPLEVSVYPVPASGKLYIRTAAPQAASLNATVYSASGNVVGRWPELVRGGVGKLDVSGLPAGSYFLQLQSGSEARSLPFIVIQ